MAADSEPPLLRTHCEERYLSGTRLDKLGSVVGARYWPVDLKNEPIIDPPAVIERIDEAIFQSGEGKFRFRRILENG
jgi:hypothetical protein